MESDAQVRLVFAGEVLEGFQPDDVKRRFGEAFKLDETRLAALFSGSRTVLKRSLSRAFAEYADEPNAKAFATSSNGAFGWRAGQGSARDAAAKALAACDANRKAYTTACQVVNVNGTWVQKR